MSFEWSSSHFKIRSPNLNYNDESFFWSNEYLTLISCVCQKMLCVLFISYYRYESWLFMYLEALILRKYIPSNCLASSYKCITSVALLLYIKVYKVVFIDIFTLIRFIHKERSNILCHFSTFLISSYLWSTTSSYFLLCIHYIVSNCRHLKMNLCLFSKSFWSLNYVLFIKGLVMIK